MSKYIVLWLCGCRYTIIKKAGDEGYFLTFGGNYEDEYSFYCIFKKGCFIRVNKNGEFPLMCTNGNQLISNEGLPFSKVKKIVEKMF